MLKLHRACYLVLLLSGISAAQSVTYVYQCKMANGHINFSDVPCRKNEKNLRAAIVPNLPVWHTVSAQPQSEATVVYHHPFCDSINSHEIHTRYNRLISDTEAALWRIRDGKSKEAWIAYYEQSRKAELQGCQ